MRTWLVFADPVTNNDYGECSIRVYQSLLIIVFLAKNLLFMLALCLMLLGTYYAQYYASIIFGGCLNMHCTVYIN